MKQYIYNLWFRFHKPEMVQWWKSADKTKAKFTIAPEGHRVMHIKGEKYPFVGQPRGHLLYGSLSPLKHEIKNQIFNHAWKRLEDGDDTKDILDEILGPVLDNICKLGEDAKYHMLPERQLVPAVKEIYRAWSEVEKLHPTYKMKMLKEIFCFIMNEDDAYRFRLQWAVRFFPKRKPLEKLKFALEMLEHAEMVGDMKERIRLLRRVFLTVLEHPKVRELFDAFVKEVDWKKVKLTKADKYYFRAKYFKVDYPEYQY